VFRHRVFNYGQNFKTFLMRDNLHYDKKFRVTFEYKITESTRLRDCMAFLVQIHSNDFAFYAL